MTITLMERATAGAKLLDEHMLGWELDIDMNSFNIENAAHCVLGQLFRPSEENCNCGFFLEECGCGYAEGKDQLGLSVARTIQLGFALDIHEGTTSAWLELHLSWVELIKERLGA